MFLSSMVVKNFVQDFATVLPWFVVSLILISLSNILECDAVKVRTTKTRATMEQEFLNKHQNDFSGEIQTRLVIPESMDQAEGLRLFCYGVLGKQVSPGRGHYSRYTGASYAREDILIHRSIPTAITRTAVVIACPFGDSPTLYIRENEAGQKNCSYVLQEYNIENAQRDGSVIEFVYEICIYGVSPGAAQPGVGG